MALGVMLLILCVLPAGMSRSAWIAAAVSGAWVYGMHISWGSKLKEIRKIYKRKSCVGLYCRKHYIHSDWLLTFSVKSNFRQWAPVHGKISTLAIAESPLIGHGTGNFVSALWQGHRRVILQTKSIRNGRIGGG